MEQVRRMRLLAVFLVWARVENLPTIVHHEYRRELLSQLIELAFEFLEKRIASICTIRATAVGIFAPKINRAHPFRFSHTSPFSPAVCIVICIDNRFHLGALWSDVTSIQRITHFILSLRAVKPSIYADVHGCNSGHELCMIQSCIHVYIRMTCDELLMCLEAF